MPDCYYACITFPVKFLNDIIKSAIETEIGSDIDWSADCQEIGNMEVNLDDKFISISDTQACWGEMYLGSILKENGIPFNKNSDGYCDNPPLVLYYRPATETEDAINIEECLTSVGDSYILLEKIKELLSLPDAELRNKLTEGVQPLAPPLEDYL